MAGRRDERARVPMVRVTDPERILAERTAARRTCARAATDADDLRYFLDVLGLWPAQDAGAASGEVGSLPMENDHGGHTKPRHKR